MTKKQKLRRNRFAADFGGKQDDFILADLDVMLDKEDPPPVPLNHFLDDEEIIDSLLINTAFEADDKLEEEDSGSKVVLIDDIEPAADASVFERFVVEPIEEVNQNRHTITEGMLNSDIHSIADFDEVPDDAVKFEEQNAMTTDTDEFDPGKSELALNEDAQNSSWVKEENPEPIKLEKTGAKPVAETNPECALESLKNAGTSELNPFEPERENIQILIYNFENKIKKATLITYISLGFAMVALLSSVVMGIMVSKAQTKISKISDLVSILEEDMTSIAEKNPDLEISNGDSFIAQLNQKIKSHPELLKEQTQSSPDLSANEKTAAVKKQATINKTLDKQQNLPVLKNKKPSETTVKKVPAEKKSTQTAARWSVYLTAFEDQDYAKSKAAKYAQKGIPVKVFAVEMNNATWYRLKVGGFKNKEDASSYADKIKKSLNLNTVSVVNK